MEQREPPVSEQCIITLDRLEVGQAGLVESVAEIGDPDTRLMEMGLVPGTRVEVARVAPLGDPIDIRVRGYHLSLRVAEAHRIRVTPVSGRS